MVSQDFSGAVKYSYNAFTVGKLGKILHVIKHASQSKASTCPQVSRVAV